MIFLFLALSHAHCTSNLTYPFTAERIARAIEKMTPREGRIFGAAINGYTYEAVAKYFKITVEEAVEITRRGAQIATNLE